MTTDPSTVQRIAPALSSSSLPPSGSLAAAPSLPPSGSFAAHPLLRERSFRKPYPLLDRQKQKSVESLVVASTTRLGALVRACAPAALRLFDVAAQLRAVAVQHRLELLLPSFFGLVMCFFGGSFMLVIAAVEAYLLCGHDTLVQCLAALADDFRAFLHANSADDADAQQQAEPEHRLQFVQRKLLLFLKTIDPQRLGAAVFALQATFFAVVSVLKIELARSVALGRSVAAVLEDNPVTLHLIDVIAAALPPDYARWAAPVVIYLLRSVVVMLSLFVHRSVTAFHSAIKGGFLVGRNFLQYLSAVNIVHVNHEETMVDEVIGLLLAFFGVVFQLGHAFALPFPLNVLLFPISCLESILLWLVAF